MPVGDHGENPGPRLRRVFPAEGRIEQPTAAPISRRYRFENYGLSAYFGLVAWNTDDLDRVYIERPDNSPRDLAGLSPFVLELQRERTHKSYVSGKPGIVRVLEANMLTSAPSRRRGGLGSARPVDRIRS